MATLTEQSNDPSPIGRRQFHLLETNRNTLWSVFDIVLYVIMQLAYGAAAFGLAMALGFIEPDLELQTIDVKAFMAATLIGLILASANMLYLRRESVKQAWAYRPAAHLKFPKLISIVIMAIALVLGAIYSHLIDQPLQPEYKVLGELVYEGTWRSVIVLMAIVVAGPAVEELLFRVQLQAAIAKKMALKIDEQKAIAIGIIISTILFAFIHFQVTAAPAQLLLGGALAIIYQRHRSFSEIWILHAAVNLLGILTINS